MRIHREGYPTLIIVGVGALIVNGLIYAITGNAALLGVTALISALIWGFFAQFFRNPPRTVPMLEGAVIAPADGTIVAIETVHEGEYFNAPRLKVSIYMSALNVHVNRVPVSGVVRYVKYHPGKYLVAYHPKSSELNERATVVIADATGREVLVRQIAGLLARRIVTYLSPEQAVRVGEELGFIKFGSRCDVFLPVDTEICVTLNQRVRGGETRLAQY